MKPARKELMLCLLLAGISQTACNVSADKEPAPPTAETITDIYGLYTSGDYAAYVSAMASCDDKPQSYTDEMAQLFKQHAKRMEAERGGVESVEVKRLEMHDHGKMANAFLGVTYKNHSCEEIILQLVFLDGRWRLR